MLYPLGEFQIFALLKYCASVWRWCGFAYKKWELLSERLWLKCVRQQQSASQRTLLWFCGSVCVCVQAAHAECKGPHLYAQSARALCVYDNNLVGHVCSGNDTVVNDHSQSRQPKIKFVNKHTHSSISVAVSE